MGCNLPNLARYRKGMATVGVIVSSAVIAVGAASASSGSGGIGSGGTTGGGASGDGAFPVKGKVTYGDGLGAGRGHQGQDLLTKCGKPVLAAHSGRVQLRDYQGAAGNYLVIDGKGKLEDTVYMHLQGKASVRKGERVSAGDVVGRVGTTGRSTACHLHFEMWSGPGYYEGGKPIDPKPFLRSVDPKR